MRSRIAFLGLAALGITAAMPVASAHEEAATSSQHRLLLPVAGSSQYLLYLEGRAGDSVAKTAERGTLYALSRSGTRTRLGALDPRRSSGVSVSGTLVVAPRIDATNWTVQWWDLADGRNGSTRVKAINEITAAPHGWVYATGGDPNGLTLWRQRTDGRVTLLAPRRSVASAWAAFLAGNRRVVIFHNDESNSGPGIGWVGFEHPGRVTQVLPHNYGQCSAPSGGLVACQTWTTGANGHYATSLIPLDGAPVTADHRRCDLGERMIVVRHEAVWVTDGGNGCGHGGRLIAMSRSGARTTSTRAFNNARAFNSYGLVAAFGRIIDVSQSHRTIYALNSVTAKPKVLVHTE